MAMPRRPAAGTRCSETTHKHLLVSGGGKVYFTNYRIPNGTSWGVRSGAAPGIRDIKEMKQDRCPGNTGNRVQAELLPRQSGSY